MELNVKADFGSNMEILKRSLMFARNMVANDRRMMLSNRMEIFKRLDESDMKAHGKTIPMSYVPLFFSCSDIGYFSKIIHDICGLLEKITRFYIQDEEYRRIFRLDKRIEELILLPSSFPSDFISPVGRIDLFMSRGGIKICEINTDGAGGMSRSDFMNLEMTANPMTRNLFPNATFRSTTLNVVLGFAQHYFSKHFTFGRKPMVAVVDFREEGVFSDFNRFIGMFRKIGVDSDFVDIRDLVFDGNELKDGKTGKTVDAIYRRAVSSVVAERLDECHGLIEAVKARKVLLLGDFRSSLMHSKSISAAVFHPKTLEKLSQEERDLIRLCFPRTFYFDGEGIDAEVLADAKSHKDRWVLKPQEGFASKGVICGKDVSEEEWFRNLGLLFGKSYVLQEFCKSLMFPSLRLDGDEIELLPVMVGIYYAAGNFAGLYNRAGAGGIIDFEHGGLYYPSVCIGTP